MRVRRTANTQRTISAFIESWTHSFPEVKHCRGLASVLGKEKQETHHIQHWKVFSECALLFYMPHSDNVSNICRARLWEGEARQIVMFYFMYVVFLILKMVSCFLLPFVCIERPRKSPGGISGIIVAALFTCRSGSFSFRIDNVPMCDIICHMLCRMLCLGN